MDFNNAFIIFNCFLLTWEYFVHPYLCKAYQGTEHSLTSSTSTEPQEEQWPWGHAPLRAAERVLLLPAAPRYRFVPRYGHHQSASALSCASSCGIATNKASWETRINSFSEMDSFCPFRKSGSAQPCCSAGNGQG